MKVSVVIAVYNEEQVIASCLLSLKKQTIFENTEIIVVDDGSTDLTIEKVKNLNLEGLTVLEQDHAGPGMARNFGAEKAKGEIVVFIDADMEFETNFIEKLIAPIVEKKAIGTFSQEEYLLNKESGLARSWNLNLGRLPDKIEPRDFTNAKGSIYSKIKSILEGVESGKAPVAFVQNKSHVFRAILTSEFRKAGGFDTDVGYTDDWSLSQKLGELAVVSPGAKYYHRNPDSLLEIWIQARWFGKNKFLTGNPVRQVFGLVRYFPLFAPIKGMVGFIKFGEPMFFPFKIVYDSAVFVSVLNSFIGEPKYK